MSLRFMFACGGTAGHINPAIAIADEMRRRFPDAEIVFVGTGENREAELVPRAGYEMFHIKASGFSRRRNFAAVKHNVVSAATFLRSVSAVRRFIRDFRPDVAVGTGGFVSAPAIFAACDEGIPTAVHEQNAFAGVTTKFLAPRVDRIFLSFPLANPIKGTEEKQTLVGNPIKEDFLRVDRNSARDILGIDRDEFMVLSFGGSLGATTINNAFCRMASRAAEEGIMTLYHGASRDYASVKERVGKLDPDSGKIKVFEYIYNMPQVMAACDVMIARSGAMTLAEIAALGKPSILIPSPNVAENHQYFNAKTYADADAAILIEEKDLSGDLLYDTLKKLYEDRKYLNSLGKNALTMAKTDSARKICDGIESLIATKRN